ncbi:MAG: DUF2812 domain-containing protein [Lysobacterales bacterium]|jgi:hypothetical protein
MTTKIRRWFWVWNEDQEKAFLEKMALKGYRLVKVGFGQYTFEEDEPRHLVYQFDFKGLGKMKEDEYVQLYEDAGWQFISRFGGWYYFAHEWSEEEPDLSLFNNNQSKRAKYRRLLVFLMIIGFPLYYQLIIMFPNMPQAKLEYPGFYFFFRILALVLVVLHALAFLKVFAMYRKMKSLIRE